MTVTFTDSWEEITTMKKNSRANIDSEEVVLRLVIRKKLIVTARMTLSFRKYFFKKYWWYYGVLHSTKYFYGVLHVRVVLVLNYNEQSEG